MLRSFSPGSDRSHWGLSSVARMGAGFTLMELVVVIVIVAALALLVVGHSSRSLEDAELVAAKATMRSLAEALVGSAVSPGYVADLRYVPGFRLAEIRLHDLQFQGAQPTFDLVAQRGWRGPYLRHVSGVRNTNAARNGAFPAAGERRFEGDTTFQERGFFTSGGSSPYGVTGDVAVGDVWGNPVVLQVPAAAAFSGSAADAKRFRYARLVSAGPDGVLTTPQDRLAGMLPDGMSAVRGDDLVVFLNRSDGYEIEEP